MGRPWRISGAEPTTVEMKGTVRDRLIDAVVRLPRLTPSPGLNHPPDQCPRSRLRVSNSCLSISPRA